MAKEFQNAAEAWLWFLNHPKLNTIGGHEPWFDLEPHMINPATNAVDGDDSLNTELQWWIEGGGYSIVKMEEHGVRDSIMRNNDYDLHTGGATADEALINFTNLVYEKYGDYKK